MKKSNLSERERQIYQWKCHGRTVSWARWCQLLDIKVRLKAPREGKDAPRTRSVAQKAK